MATDIKDLKALLKVMRSNGVLHFKNADIDIQLSEQALFPVHGNSATNQEVDQQQHEIPSDEPWANFPDGILTPEQLIFYSAGGKPEDDPENVSN